MKRKSRKLVSCFAATVLCLTMLFGVTVQAGTLNPKAYFRVSVATEIVIGRAAQPTMVGDMGGTIIDWGQAVSAGSTVSASLSRISGTSVSYSFPTVTSYEWKLVNKSGTYTRTYYGRSISIPTTFAGGYLEVTANTASDTTWSAAEIGARVSIS